VEALSDAKLVRRLYGEPAPTQSDRAEPDPVWMHRELRRRGVTLELLHLEYLSEHPSGFRYTAFCDRYRQWLSRQSVVMRQVHRAGEKGFVDYSGVRPHFIDASTGQKVDVELFVAALGASSLTFATATLTQRVGDFVSAHVKAFRYFGGVPKITVPDQLRSAVSVRAATSRRFIERIASSVGIATRRSCRRVLGTRATKQRWRWPCRWLSDGSWLVFFATKHSSRSKL
jgi:transposase